MILHFWPWLVYIILSERAFWCTAATKRLPLKLIDVHWPHIWKDTLIYIWSCDRCQRVGKGLKPTPAPLMPLSVCPNLIAGSLPACSKPNNMFSLYHGYEVKHNIASSIIIMIMYSLSCMYMVIIAIFLKQYCLPDLTYFAAIVRKHASHISAHFAFLRIQKRALT